VSEYHKDCNVAKLKGAQALMSVNKSGTNINIETMGKLAGALSFITSPEDPAVLAMRKAVESGDPKDIKQARTLFLRTKPTHRNAALAMLISDD